jgi:hypothetical protein
MVRLGLVVSVKTVIMLGKDSGKEIMQIESMNNVVGELQMTLNTENQ